MTGEMMMPMAERLGEALLQARLRLVTAESCTGGGLGYVITSIAGSSDWYERGFVTYSNAAKEELLGVPVETLAREGAVSEAVAAAMAEGALRQSHADLSVAVTGIAGPEGGSREKPVGTVCLAWSRRNGDTRTAHVVFQGDRAGVREQAILMAMQGLLDIVESAK